MKYGYSILLAEIIDAKHLSYTDCRDFQIVCPVCKEPVFKKTTAKQNSVHFLSHYTKSDKNKECELRVGAYTKASVSAANCISRGQSLDDFKMKLPSMLNRVINVDSAMISKMTEFRGMRLVFDDLKKSLNNNGLNFIKEMHERELNEAEYNITDIVNEKSDEVFLEIFRYIQTSNMSDVLNILYSISILSKDLPFFKVTCLTDDENKALVDKAEFFREAFTNSKPISTLKFNMVLSNMKKPKNSHQYKFFIETINRRLIACLKIIIKNFIRAQGLIQFSK